MISKINTFFKSLSQGLSSFNIFNKTDYSKYITTPEEISKKAWKMTGDSLKRAIDNIHNQNNKNI